MSHPLKLRIYTIPSCKYCNELKSQLNLLQIPYHDINVNIETAWGDWLEDKYYTQSYPIIEVSRGIYQVITFISNTDLEERDTLFIFQTIDQIIIKLKQIYAL